MVYCKIGNTDVSYLVQSMKVDMEVILSDKSGRNAQADNVVDIVARKDKVEIVFRPMDANDMAKLLSAVSDFVVNLSFLDPRTKQLKTISAYINTPQPEFYCILDGKILYKTLPLNFIQM